MKKFKTKHYENHTSRSQLGMGDHYGVAGSQKIGKMRSSTLDTNANSKIYGKKPKSLA